jgi:hypothetical protein
LYSGYNCCVVLEMKCIRSEDTRAPTMPVDTMSDHVPAAEGWLFWQKGVSIAYDVDGGE